ncbi:Uncharacterized protein conserved in bacteria DUF1009 [Elusimicrobium minutum Pei191]|uniref:Uncharacterized protein conserved in bacteria DUF1009 n=1 Tax=Elusimicrobium minutum (strain Pei191) TaxID=445932 RepID=B2KAV0_ELUMP|nr:UDP-2,3-diacylglucosamine diphosphatase LpxI [Elusimicrobium minutum]ACC97646.1 Uncharacterized protein conserved in bacteria DUF1009 [Elusimicrobium minutum Pei191]
MEKIGIIAGEGKMPVYIAAEAKEKGVAVYVACIKGNAFPSDFEAYSASTVEFKMGQLSKGINFFKENGVTKVLMAGRVKHTAIFSNIMPDLRGAKMLAGLKDMKAQTILRAIINEFEKEGISFISSVSFLEKYMPGPGLLGKRPPTEEEKLSIEFGIEIAKALSGLDIGLTVVVADRAVVALEGMEGTDECIKRAGMLYKNSSKKNKSLVVVKVARPQQDFRFDLPIIGKGTIKSAVESGAKVVVIEGRKTLILDMDEVIKMADKASITLLAF